MWQSDSQKEEREERREESESPSKAQLRTNCEAESRQERGARADAVRPLVGKMKRDEKMETTFDVQCKFTPAPFSNEMVEKIHTHSHSKITI